MIKTNRLLVLLAGLILIGIVALVGLLAVIITTRGGVDVAALFATRTPVPTATPTLTATPTQTLTPSLTPTSTNTLTPTSTLTDTPRPTDTPTITPRFTETPRLTDTPRPTNTPVASATPKTLVETGPNLLGNPSFEEGSSVYNNDGDLRVPNGWAPFWNFIVVDQCHNLKPHYEIEQHPTHVKDGSSSARQYTGYATHNGGLLQQAATTPGQTYQFSVYGFAWSTNDPVVDSPSTATATLSVGIDPAGGTNPDAGSVVWSPGVVQMDSFGFFSVRATATASKVTVFARANSDFCVARNDVFWDAASLRLMAGQ